MDGGHEFFTGSRETELTQEYIHSVLCSWDWMDIQKMVFIYRAVQNGWCVRKLRNGKFEFKMDVRTQELMLEDYLKKFILYNLCIQHFPTPRFSSQFIESARVQSSLS